MVPGCSEEENEENEEEQNEENAETADGGTSQVDAAVTGSTDGGSQEADALAPGAEGYLLVAELAEGKEAIHVFSLPGLEHTGELDDVKLANHLGALALQDGRVITADDKHQEIIAIEVSKEGKPSIVNRVKADLGSGATWGCGDAKLQYLAVSSGREDTDKQVANIVKLDDFSLTPFEVTLNKLGEATEELHPFIAGEPAQLLLSIGGEVQSYPLSSVLAGTATEPSASVVINTGSHGPVASHKTGAVYITTAPGTGFDGVTLNPFARVQIIPWDVDGLSTGRNARPRLSWDEQFIYGAIAQSTPAGAEKWAERAVDFHVADLTTGSAKRIPLTTGIVPKFQLSRRYAMFANITADQDQAILLDVDAASTTFQTVVGRIPLPRLLNGPRAGESTAGKEARSSAITPDGKWAFVSHGGEGKVSVIDTATRALVGTIELDSPLSGGGYLFALQPGTAPVDTCTR